VEIVGILAVALGSYAVHDTVLLYVASLMKRKVGGKRVGFPADITSYFNLQRIGLTLWWGLGWSSEYNFLYKNASEFRHGRLNVVLLHLLSPIIYIIMTLLWFYAGYYGSFLPSFVRVFFTQNLSSFNLSMSVLMLLPLAPLSVGMALFSYYTKDGYQEKLRQIEFYGNLVLIGIVIADRLGYQIIPFGLWKNQLWQLLQTGGFLQI
jgi:hypothetical protein